MPMLAVAGVLPLGAGWAYEFKWDGIRTIAAIGDDRVRLFARSGAEITAGYPELAGLGRLARQAVLDGEIVAGGPSGSTATYMIFDLLRLEGVDWTRRPYAQRHAALTWLASGAQSWRVPPCFADGGATLAIALAHQLTGVVAKRLDGTYHPGQRTSTWIKVVGR